MPAISSRTKRVRTLLATRGMTVGDMAESIQRSEGTIVNTLTDSIRQPRVEQLITNFLGVEIWPGVKPKPGSVAVNFPEGTEIRFPAGRARIVAVAIGAGAELAGEVVRLRRDLIVKLVTTPSSQK